jgi:hypothetical protein
MVTLGSQSGRSPSYGGSVHQFNKNIDADVYEDAKSYLQFVRDNSVFCIVKMTIYIALLIRRVTVSSQRPIKYRYMIDSLDLPVIPMQILDSYNPTYGINNSYFQCFSDTTKFSMNGKQNAKF